VDDLAGALADLHARGLRIVGADGDAPLTAREADLRGPIAIVVGSEGRGLGAAVRRRCDLLVRIPMHGRIESLNASVAGSILLYEAAAQRGLPERPPEPDRAATDRDAGEDDAERAAGAAEVGAGVVQPEAAAEPAGAPVAQAASAIEPAPKAIRTARPSTKATATEVAETPAEALPAATRAKRSRAKTVVAQEPVSDGGDDLLPGVPPSADAPADPSEV
jgi:hypothetical protein